MTTADGLVSPTPGSAAPLQVLLNVYDVAQGDGKSTVVRLNNLVGPSGLGLGGVFHGAIVLGTVEFSFGFCERGTGVYAVKAGQNPMYTFRETISLGPTGRSMQEIRDIIQDLKTEWPGASYDLLYRNCCHFCVDLAARLGVEPVPGWLNRFASGAAATITITQDTVKTVQEFGAEVGRLWNKTVAAASQQQQQLVERLQSQRGTPTGTPRHSSTSSSSSSSLLEPRSGSTPRGSQLAGSAAQAGQQLWSGLTQAGHQLKATTTRLAQAAAAKTSSVRSGGISSPRTMIGDAWRRALQQARQQDAVSWPSQGPSPHGSSRDGDPAAAAAAAARPPASLPGQAPGHPGVGADRSASTVLLPGAQPKLSKEYRLSSGGWAAAAAAVAAAGGTAAAAAGSCGGRADGAGALQSAASDDALQPFLSVDEDPFVALMGEDDAEDDPQQRAAVEVALQHTPSSAAPGP